MAKIILLLLLFIVAAIVSGVIYALRQHEGKIVAILNGSYLVRIDSNRLVYVGDEYGFPRYSTDDKVCVISPIRKNLRKSKKDEKKYPEDFLILGGYQTSREEIDGERVLKQALLASKVEAARWLAKDENGDYILLDLANDNYKMGDVIKYIPQTKTLERYYFV